MDVNDLKRVNDTLGYQRGDAVLIRVAEALRRGIRGHDIVGRLTGDEFVVLFRNTDRDAAETILRQFERFDATESGAPPGDHAVTLSWGVATSPNDGAAVDVLMASANRRLRVVKRMLPLNPATGILDPVHGAPIAESRHGLTSRLELAATMADALL